MRRYHRMPVWLTIFTVLLLLSGIRAAQAAAGSALFQQCAKACRECATACQVCNKHCAEMVKAGMKQHQASLRLSEDCRDLCTTSAKLCARQGPMSRAAVEACLKATIACGAECRKYPKMAEMAACARACDACGKACRKLLAAK